MLLDVQNIEEIGVTDINGVDITVKEGDQFETLEQYGRSYLINYPQYFKVASILKANTQKVEAKKEISNEEEKTVEVKKEIDEPTNAEIAQAIVALGGKPSGNREKLKAQLAELQASNVSDEKAKEEEKTE